MDVRTRSAPRVGRGPGAVRRAWALAGVLLAGACSDTGMPPPTGTEATQLVKSAGDQQSWYFDNPLPEPYGVLALDAAGLAVPGVEVSWSVTTGGGSVDPTQGETDASGTATAVHTLGSSGAGHTVTASATGLAPVVFSATGAAPPTSGAVSVGDNFFMPQETVVKVGGTITWTWGGFDIHNVTYTSGPSPRPADSTTQDTGMHASTFTAEGRYDYVCTIHAGMEGTVVVVR